MNSSSGAVQDAGAVIRKVGEDWARNWNSGDLEKVLESYADDAVYMPPHHPSIHGKPAIRKYLTGPMQHGVRDLVYDVTYIRQSGDLAYDVGLYSMTIPRPDGTTRKDMGKYLVVWRRGDDGQWKIAADSWSSNMPLE